MAWTCKRISFTRARNIEYSVYYIGEHALENLNIIRYLRVIFDSKMSFEPDINEIINKATQTLGFIRRKFKLFKSPLSIIYLSLVKSILNIE